MKWRLLRSWVNHLCFPWLNCRYCGGAFRPMALSVTTEPPLCISAPCVYCRHLAYRFVDDQIARQCLAAGGVPVAGIGGRVEQALHR